MIFTQDVGAHAFGLLQEELDEIVLPALEELDLRPVSTGTTTVAYRGINGITFDLRKSLLLAFVVITFLISAIFRSPRLGLLCLLPNAAPLVVGYGLLGLVGWDLEPGTAVVFTVALGIAVDDTIHLLARYREELENWAPRQALTNAVTRCGRAVMTTSIILAFGFFVNMGSTFPGNRTFGALGGAVILSALLCDLFVLPPLLLLWGGDLGVQRAEASAVEN